MKKLYFLILPILFLAACGEDETPPSNKFVIEAFLFAGEPVDDIYIKTTFPITEEEDISEPISTATVTLYKENTAYTLIPSDSAGYYHYPDSNLMVEIGDEFQIEVTHDGITATAETFVPEPPTGLQVMPDTLIFPPLNNADSTRAIIAALQMNATWDNPNEDFYYLVIETVGNIEPVFPASVQDLLARFRYVSEPTDGNVITVPGVGFTFLGTHKVKLYRINQEYVDLYLNQEQDSRDLNEPPTNVTNALGVFSAFSSQEVLMEVVRM